MALIGGHMSIAGGIALSIERGEDLGCEAIQIFTSSSRTWSITPLQEEDIRAFKEAKKNAQSVKVVVAHNSYLLNLSTTNEQVRKKSVDFFIQTMNRCEALEISALITHPGSHLGAGAEAGIAATSKSFDEVAQACKGFKTRLLIENTAGQGDCVGSSFEELSQILDGCQHSDAVGFCFDTQHAFAAGYDLRTEESYEKTFEEWDRLIGRDRIFAFHLNDALKELGCRVDRHANLGKGFLGETVFKKLMNDPKFADTPMCLETDPGDDLVNYRDELRLLRSFRTH